MHLVIYKQLRIEVITNITTVAYLVQNISIVIITKLRSFLNVLFSLFFMNYIQCLVSTGSRKAVETGYRLGWVKTGWVSTGFCKPVTKLSKLVVKLSKPTTRVLVNRQ